MIPITGGGGGVFVSGKGFITVYKGTENLTFVRVESPLTYHILIPIIEGGGGVFVSGQGFATVYKGTENLTFVRVEFNTLHITSHLDPYYWGVGGGVGWRRGLCKW